MMDIHLGKKIKEVFVQSSMSVSEFAAAIHRTRTTIYDIFNRRSIDIELLMQISEVLNHDFIGDFYANNKQAQADERLIVVKEVPMEEFYDIISHDKKVKIYKAVAHN